MNFRVARTGSGKHSRGREAPPSRTQTVPPDGSRRGRDAPLPPTHAGAAPADTRGEPRPARRRRWIARGLLLASLLLALHAGWIPAKAALAQELLHASWDATLRDNGNHRPWPWADTHPVARILQPRLGISQVVLAGDSGRTLAFGPGWAEASAAPAGTSGSVIISGHRDTHFSWLRDLRDGDRVRLETRAGPRDFVVSHTQVVDSRTHRIAPLDHGEQLVLVTCWPFDASAARGPMRYLVTLSGEPTGTDGARHF